MDFIKKKISSGIWMYILWILVFYVISMGYFLMLSISPNGMQYRRFLTTSILVVPLIITVARHVEKKYFITFFITGMAWATTYPISNYLTYMNTSPKISNHYDITFGIYIFTGLMAVAYVLNRYIGKKLTSFICALAEFLILLMPMWQWGYIYVYGTSVSEAAIMAIHQTTPPEAKEYILSFLGYGGVIAVLVWYVVVICLLYRVNCWAMEHVDYVTMKLRTFIIVGVLGVAAIVYSFADLFMLTAILDHYNDVHVYFTTLAKYNNEHKAVYDNLKVTTSARNFDKPGTIIFVIGESETRDHMSAYGYRVKTTPWLDEQLNNPDFVVFKHAYAPWHQTVPVLERALSPKSQYNEVEFNSVPNIVDIAKKAGYKTYWFGNTTVTDSADTPMTVVAKTADKSRWTVESTFDVQYDGTTVNYLKDVDPNENNFIIMHFVGSHHDANQRYPKEFKKWGGPGTPGMVDAYHNSILYTDHVLSEVYKYGREHLNMRAMFYFSDHGGIPDEVRHPDYSPWMVLRVPYFIYASQDYQKLYPEIFTTLKKHKNTYFTNDLTFELVCGFLDIKSDCYDETNSLASPKFKFTRDTLTTRMGKLKLSEDNEEYKYLKKKD